MRALKKVLHIEDEADIREVVKLALEAVGGLTVESCASGREGLERIEAFGPDLVLLDAMMPEMSGADTLAKLRAAPATATTPVIFMTAKIQPTEVEGFQQLGAIGLVAKPFDPMTLADEIKAIWVQSESLVGR